jgi:hypothetical protein
MFHYNEDPDGPPEHSDENQNSQRYPDFDEATDKHSFGTNLPRGVGRNGIVFET